MLFTKVSLLASCALPPVRPLLSPFMSGLKDGWKRGKDRYLGVLRSEKKLNMLCVGKSGISPSRGVKSGFFLMAFPIDNTQVVRCKIISIQEKKILC